MLNTAFILGLAGSLHCAGMCSPLAFAVTSRKKSVWVNRLAYNLGRIFTYGILGAIVSSIGVALPLERFQTGLSIGMGVILISVGFIGIGKIRFQAINKIISKLTSWIKARFSAQIQNKGVFSTLLLGALNGLLPCGLTFIALTACLITPTALDGFYFMLMFGVGTLPVMIGLVSVIRFISGTFQFNISKVNMVMLILAGSLLIGRTHFKHTPASTQNSDAELVVCE